MIYRFLRILKVIRGKDFYVFPDIRISKKTYGNKNASWTIHPDVISEKSIVYSFGVGNEISFDLSMIEKYDVTINAFDPTPKSVLWLKSQSLPQKFIFHQKGLASYDGKAEFALPENPNHVSASILNKNSSQGVFVAEVMKLETIMHELGHNKIDLLKMDIEGAEYDVIDSIIESKLDIGQILIEFHHRFENVGISKSKNAIKKLKNAGYLIFDVSETGEEISFILQK